MVRSFDRGTLLWIDDEFLHTDMDGDQGAVRVWEKLGNDDNRIYRLMDLFVETATSKAEAFDAITQLSKERSHNSFVQAVVDLRIPARDGEDAEMIHGIAVAKRLQSLGIPFTFLSSSSDATRELKLHGLDGVPYKQKLNPPNKTRMPEELVRHLLSEFRNNIDWLDLSKVVDSFDRRSRHPLVDGGRWSHYFPFFSGYRDFVERWEARSGRVRSGTIVLRSPKDHSDMFVALSTAIIINGQQSRVRPIMHYVAAAEVPGLLAGGALFEANKHLVVRFDGKTGDGETLRQLLGRALRCQCYFVIPDDESADELLQEIASHRDVVYDDLPRTRPHDRTAREQLVRACSRLVYQKLQFQSDDGDMIGLNPIFLHHPEVLVDPVHWAFLLDHSDVDENVSDVYEILDAFGGATAALESGSSELIDRLINGRPLQPRQMLCPKDNVFRAHPEKHSDWRERALSKWLATSWQSPYGVDIGNSSRSATQFSEEWEEHCLTVVLDLAKVHHERTGVDDRSDPKRTAVTGAANFLNHAVVVKMLSGTVKPQDWLQLETERWPHQQFPMPAALHRRLRQQGRYLWVQTDLLDRAAILLSGRDALQRVEARAERHSLRMDWLARAIPALPQEWRESAVLLYQVLETRSIDQAWADENRKKALWEALYAIVQNAAPIGLIFYSLQADPRTGLVDEVVKALTHKVRGAGTLIGKLRGKRDRLVPHVFRIVERQHHNWRTNFSEAQDFIRVAAEFRAFEANQKFIGQIGSAIDIFATELEKISTQDPEGEGSDERLVNEMLKLLYREDVGMNSGIHHADFQPNIGMQSPLHFGQMRGLSIDALMGMLEATEKLRALLTPIVYCDGYHFLGLVQELRNLYKSAPEHLSPRVLHKQFELFLLGFEGMVAQLKGTLQFAGRPDLAAALPVGTIQLQNQRGTSFEEQEEIRRLLTIVGDSRNYSVFTLGIAGSAAIKSHCSAMASGRIVSAPSSKSLAAE